MVCERCSSPAEEEKLVYNFSRHEWVSVPMCEGCYRCVRCRKNG
jgi:hypothetical protein